MKRELIVNRYCIRGVQWFSGRVLHSRLRGCSFEPHRKAFFFLYLVLVKLRKTCPEMSKKIWTGMLRIKKNKIKRY